MQRTEVETALDEQHRDSIDLAVDMSYRMTNPKLAALRAQNPFIPILQMPNVTTTFTLAANTALDIDIPSGSKLAWISGSDEYYITRNGKAQVPPAAGTAPDTASGAHQNPEGYFMYVEEIKQLSIIAPNAGTRVSIAFYAQL